MPKTGWVVVLLLVAVLVAGCTRGGEKGGDQSSLTPQFAPDTSVATTAPRSGGSSTTTTTTIDAGAGGAPLEAQLTSTTAVAGQGGARPPSQVPGPTVPGATTAAIVDRQGDLTPSPSDPPPPWADLVGGTLLRRADGFELRVRLGGGSAPSTTDRDHTMNVASFYDVNGDGIVDYEVWANLADGGWGGSWFDNRGKKARFNEGSGVAIEVAGDEVVLRFPLSRVGEAERFRWSLASEWGRYAVLGTDATARDDAPDYDAAARFPG